MGDSKETAQQRSASAAFFKITLPVYLGLTAVTIINGRFMTIDSKMDLAITLLVGAVSAVAILAIAVIQMNAVAKTTWGNVLSKTVSAILFLIFGMGTLMFAEGFPKFVAAFS